MPPKRPASAKASGSEPKRQRKMLTIAEEVKLLDMLKEGRSFMAVGCCYVINIVSVNKYSITINKYSVATSQIFACHGQSWNLTPAINEG